MGLEDDKMTKFQSIELFMITVCVVCIWFWKFVDILMDIGRKK